PSVAATVTANPLPPTPVITANGPLSFCEGGSVQLSSTSANGYLWSNGATTQTITATTTGNYSVVTSNGAGCNSATSNILSVTVNQNPPVPLITQSGNTLSSNAPTGNQWYFNGTIISGATNQIYNYVTPGQYTVTVTDANGCSSSSLPHTGNFVNGSITILSNGEEFRHAIAPNPVNNQASINYHLQSPADISIQIIAINGSRAIQLLPPIRQAAGYYRAEINRQLAALTPGMYIVQYLVNGQTVTEKFIVNR
ncbi:MAG: T9SS type A sorting domain-containing protein, partial [Ferruginibacter sp.]